jgi:hypothetical protein
MVQAGINPIGFSGAYRGNIVLSLHIMTNNINVTQLRGNLGGVTEQ